jgi:hypothetical protein
MMRVRRTIGWLAPSAPAFGALVLSALALAAMALAAPGAGGADASRATRTDLEAERRRVVALESEVALASTRKPYLVLDLGSRTLRYRLMGMTTRELPLPGLTVKGLAAATAAAPSPTLAGIFTLREKDGDPRLKPLSPEQVEAGADDENAANVLPPEPPKAYGLKFKQPIAVRVEGREQAAGVHGVWAGLSASWHRLFGSESDDDERLVVSLMLDAGTAAELYRSLLPEEHWLVLPPSGFVLPAAGQEAPPRPKPPKPIPVKPAKPVEPPGVPFQIPPPVDDNGTHGSDTQDGGPPASGGGRDGARPPSPGTPSTNPTRENAA